MLVLLLLLLPLSLLALYLFYYCARPMLVYMNLSNTELAKTLADAQSQSQSSDSSDSQAKSKSSSKSSETKKSAPMATILGQCSYLYKPYIPTPFLVGGNLMSLVAASGRKRPRTAFKRELFTISDGGTSAIDWLAFTKNNEKYVDQEGVDFFTSSVSPTTDPTAPIFLLLHGMNGGSMESYARWMCINAAKRGWRPGVLISRGCCGLKLTTWRLYNAGWTLDLKEVALELRKRWPDAPIIAAGVSLGANILTNYVGEEGASCPLTAAVSISNPIDLILAGDYINTSFFGKHIYSPYITVGLKRLVAKNRAEIESGPHKVDFDLIASCKNNAEFDEYASCKFFGLEHAIDYYVNFMCKKTLQNIKIPMLFITAADDPMFSTIPVDAFKEKCSENPNIAMVVTRTGGHYGFFEVSDMLSFKSYINYSTQTWAEKTAYQFFDKALEIVH